MNLSHCANSLAILAAGLGDGHEPTILRQAREGLAAHGYTIGSFKQEYEAQIGTYHLWRCPAGNVIAELEHDDMIQNYPPEPLTWVEQEAHYHNMNELSAFERAEMRETRRIHKSWLDLMEAYWSLSC